MSRLTKLIALIAMLFVVGVTCACSPQAAPVPTSTPAPVLTPTPTFTPLPSPTTMPASTPFPTTPAPNAAVATIVATRDFGTEVILAKSVEVDGGLPAMEALTQSVEVETRYGGGFVNAIGGIRSQFPEVKKDWFLYINGLQSNSGAGSYTLHPGDVEHWDFRDWSFWGFTPAIIGDFPEPFLHGYDGRVPPTVIVYDESLQEEAQSLRDYLIQLGIEDVSTTNTAGLSQDEKESCHLILVGTANCPLISELNQVYRKLGLFVHFDAGRMIALNSSGEIEKRYGSGTGVIQATQNPWNPRGIGACENVVWMISGTDEDGVRAAVAALTKYHSELKYAFGAIVANGEIIKVPR